MSDLSSCARPSLSARAYTADSPRLAISCGDACTQTFVSN